MTANHAGAALCGGLISLLTAGLSFRGAGREATPPEPPREAVAADKEHSSEQSDELYDVGLGCSTSPLTWR